MADTLIDLLAELQELTAKLEQIGFGGDSESVTHNGVTRATVAKQIRDQYNEIQAMVDGQIPYTTLALAQAAGAPPTIDVGGTLYHRPVRVIGDPTASNDGLYAWDGSSLIKSAYDTDGVIRINKKLAADDAFSLSESVPDGIDFKNKINPGDADVVIGGFPSDSDGAILANASYNTTGFVRVVAGVQYTLSYKHYVAWYDIDKNFVAGSDSSVTSKTLTAPADAAYMRASFNTGSWPTAQVEKGDIETDYEPYHGTRKLSQSALSPNIVASQHIAADSVTERHAGFIVQSRNLFDKSAATLNAYLSVLGVVTVSDTYGYSDVIEVTPGETYTASSQMRFTTYYDENQAVVPSGPQSVTSVTIPAGVHYIRFTFRLTSIDTLQFELGTESTELVDYGFTLTLSGKPLRILPTAIPTGAVESSNMAANSITERSAAFLVPSKNLFYKTSATEGYFLAHYNAPTESASYAYSDFIEVTPGETYTANATMRFTTYFNANQSHIEGGSSDPVTQMTIPAGVQYVRVSIYLSSIDTFQLELGSESTTYEPYGYTLSLGDVPVMTEAEKNAASGKGSLRGLSFATLGDSITAANNWQPTVQSEIGLSNHTNCGIGGTQVSGVGAEAMWQDARINAIPSDTQVVIFMGGTNDWVQNRALGTIDDTDPELTFFGGLNVVAEKLMSRFPLARVFFNTTPYGEIVDFAARGWADSAHNTLGHTTHDYAACIRAVAARWGFPVIDIAAEAGFNSSNVDVFMADDGNHIHPDSADDNAADVYNDSGADRLAQVVVSRLQVF